MLSEKHLSGRMESEELFRLLLETKEYAISMLSPSGIIMSWNLGGAHILGYSGKELIGTHISVCYCQRDKDVGLVERILKDSLNNGRSENEVELLKKDRSVFFANVICTPLYREMGSLHGFAIIIRDITLQKQLANENKLLHESLEERVRKRTTELENVNQELNAFSYSVSHDLRTPLRAISGFSKMLLEDYEKKLDAEGNRLINTIIENAEMMGQLIDDLLSFSRLSRMEAHDQIVDMKVLAKKCFSNLMQVYPGVSECVINLGDIRNCSADRNMMKQVWMNLIDNALKYTSKKDRPEVKIGSTEEEHFITYFIGDNGVGFDMRYASKLFTVFQRLHSNEEFTGTGLGLALVNRIITKHGGRIWAESEVDKGATFYFTVPKNSVAEQIGLDRQ